MALLCSFYIVAYRCCVTVLPPTVILAIALHATQIGRLSVGNVGRTSFVPIIMVTDRKSG